MATESTEFGTGKTIFVLAIVVGCFAILWPKIFHPMIQGGSSTYDTGAPQSYRGKPVCIPCEIKFEIERNNQFYYEFCNLAIKRKEGSLRHQPPSLVFRLCKEVMANKCGVELNDDLVERFRKWNDTDYNEMLMNFTSCLKHEFNIERHNIIQVLLENRNITSKHVFPRQERPPHLRHNVMHPALREKGQNIAPGPRTIEKEARPGPMPGTRPTMGGPGHVGTGTSKQTSTMSIIMPVYTIAIVIFFIYTIMKIILKKPQDTTPKVQDFHLDPEQRKFIFAEEYTEADPYSIRDYMRKQHEKERAAQAKEELEKENAKIVIDAIEGIVKEIDQYKAQKAEAKKKDSSKVAMKEVQHAAGIIKEEPKSESPKRKKVPEILKDEAKEVDDEISEYKSIRVENGEDEATESGGTEIEDLMLPEEASEILAPETTITEQEEVKQIEEPHILPTDLVKKSEESDEIKNIVEEKNNIKVLPEQKDLKTVEKIEQDDSADISEKLQKQESQEMLFYEDTLTDEAREYVRHLAQQTVQQAISDAIKLLESDLENISHQTVEQQTEPSEQEVPLHTLEIAEEREEAEEEVLEVSVEETIPESEQQIEKNAEKRLSFDTPEEIDTLDKEATYTSEDVIKDNEKEEGKPQLSLTTEAIEEKDIMPKKSLEKVEDDEVKEDIILEKESELEETEEELDEEMEELKFHEDTLSEEVREYVRYLAEQAVARAIQDAKKILGCKYEKADRRSQEKACESLEVCVQPEQVQLTESEKEQEVETTFERLQPSASHYDTTTSKDETIKSDPKIKETFTSKELQEDESEGGTMRLMKMLEADSKPPTSTADDSIPCEDRILQHLSKDKPEALPHLPTVSDTLTAAQEEELIKEGLKEAMKEPEVELVEHTAVVHDGCGKVAETCSPLEHAAVVHDGGGQSAVLVHQSDGDQQVHYMDELVTNFTPNFLPIHQFYIAEVIDVKHNTFPSTSNDTVKTSPTGSSSHSSFEMVVNNGDSTSSFEHLSRNGTPPVKKEETQEEDLEEEESEEEEQSEEET